MKFLTRYLQRRKDRKFKIINLPDGYKAIPAFTIGGIQYYQFDDAFKIPAGRAMATLTFYAELEMRCDREYLTKHIRATELILNGGESGKKIDLTMLAQINRNLRERLDLVPFPDYVYKIASVLFFDKNEEKFSYDVKYNEKKIKLWKETEGVLDFFLTKPLKTLIPFSESAELSALSYLELAEQFNQKHLSDLLEVLSREESK